ncbi:MAG: hypothetical protein ABMA00_13695 [Gemmatimonas sp.]
MRNLLRRLFSVSLLAASADAQTTEALPIDRMISLVRERHVLRDSIDWPVVERHVRGVIRHGQPVYRVLHRSKRKGGATCVGARAPATRMGF